jgi:hypothetical protein
VVGLVIALASGPCLAAQSPPASPDDVGTITDIVRASYEAMSGPAGQPRQWRRDSTLYMPAATFVALHARDGQVEATVMTPEQYRRQSFPAFERLGLYETEIGQQVERFGNVAQVRSVAAARRTPDGPLLGRYVNYFQLFWDGTRWWIAGMVWDEETPSHPIPSSWIGQH